VTRVEKIRECLQVLAPVALEITDQSHLHKGHPGARDGRGHFHVRIVSQRFENQSKLNRHKQVYQALGDLMHTEIHALGINALTPVETKLTEDKT